MKNWWRGLNARERMLVGIAGFIVAFGLIYWVAWHPTNERIDRMTLQVAKLQRQLIWMQAKLPLRASEPRSIGADVDPKDIAAVVSVTGRKFQVPAQRIEVKGASLELVYTEPLLFDPLIEWLEMLKKDHDINVLQLEVQAVKNGNVSIKRLVLGRR